ncbi:hypothetical protein ACFOOM_11025 [Streptomyces echinoruber]|uniref:Uncharacterized protein n=1 Tax=Streptomyces echinoruber TaxID=68898 RepID=A0A918RZP7_9ACTN|nr:hypothetical protein [Streptomyces echinoruber]GHA14844.1 hypothetical protein GCM10010389_61970 [Streptomyces echinoruber]
MEEQSPQGNGSPDGRREPQVELRKPPNGDGGGGDGVVPVTPKPPPLPPPFQAANYMFRLDGFTISETRSPRHDTVHVSFGLQVGDKKYPPQIKKMGDLGEGNYPVDLEFGPVPVTDAGERVIFNYTILNNGHDSDANIAKTLIDATTALLSKKFGAGTFWTVVLTILVDFIGGIFFANCDGVVAVDQVELSGEELWARTVGRGSAHETRYYPGTDSPVGCGSNSAYWVSWSILGAGVIPPEINPVVSVPAKARISV